MIFQETLLSLRIIESFPFLTDSLLLSFMILTTNTNPTIHHLPYPRDAPIVAAGDGTIPLLSRGVPDLQLDVSTFTEATSVMVSFGYLPGGKFCLVGGYSPFEKY